MPKSGINAIPIINFRIFKYDENEYDRTIGNIKSKLSGQFKRNSTIDVTGTGFTPEKKDIITFNPLDY
ncbi:MAG: hypothetical protein IPH32_18135 [Bacteroidetes bacterium]|nr:hypothetical protein [Bacteroidota bacterium]